MAQYDALQEKVRQMEDQQHVAQAATNLIDQMVAAGAARDDGNGNLVVPTADGDRLFRVNPEQE